MTTPEHTPAPEAAADDENAVEQTVDAGKQRPAIPDFRFSFKASEFAPAKTQDEPYYKKKGKSDHTKIPGAAPHGTRKSMGKR
ncbi:hypothetical protein [Pseudomonas sp. NA-150]|uniref:hypothetical protein n=1 Tax=Pseudomonas sp. NA-150 TaxID=3367525 RepID=UPI0037C5EA1E